MPASQAGCSAPQAETTIIAPAKAVPVGAAMCLPLFPSTEKPAEARQTAAAVVMVVVAVGVVKEAVAPSFFVWVNSREATRFTATRRPRLAAGA